MTHTVIRTETYEWEEEICDNCNHPVSMHYDIPTPVYRNGTSGEVLYVAEGCMALSGNRKMGTNPYLRCECMHSV